MDIVAPAASGLALMPEVNVTPPHAFSHYPHFTKFGAQ
jgi:hypothetical protein